MGSVRLHSARLGSARLGCVRLGLARRGLFRHSSSPVRHGSGKARLGSARFRLGSAWPSSARLSSARYRSSWFGSARLRSAPLGSSLTNPRTAAAPRGPPPAMPARDHPQAGTDPVPSRTLGTERTHSVLTVPAEEPLCPQGTPQVQGRTPPMIFSLGTALPMLSQDPLGTGPDPHCEPQPGDRLPCAIPGPLRQDTLAAPVNPSLGIDLLCPPRTHGHRADPYHDLHP